MDAELRFHIEAYAEHWVRVGVPREEAMCRERLEFAGSSELKKSVGRRSSSGNRFRCQLDLEPLPQTLL